MREMVAVLHNVRSVHNVGSIFRTADAAGFTKVYSCGITPSPLDRFGKIRSDFAKVSLGAEQSVAWEAKKSIRSVLSELTRNGFIVYAVEQDTRSKPYHAVRASRGAKIAIVVGNEIRGLPPSVLRVAHEVLEIPMYGAKESLNVAVAFGVVAFGVRHAARKV